MISPASGYYDPQQSMCRALSWGCSAESVAQWVASDVSYDYKDTIYELLFLSSIPIYPQTL